MVVRRKKKVTRRHKKSRFLKYVRGGAEQFAQPIDISTELRSKRRAKKLKEEKEGEIKWWHYPSRLDRWVNSDTIDPEIMKEIEGSYKYGNPDQRKLALEQLRIQLMINDIHEDPEEYIKAYQKGSHRRKGWVKNATRVGLTAAGLLATGLGAYYFGIPGMIQSALTSAATTGAEAAAAKTLDGTLTQEVKSESMEGGLPSGVTSGATTTTTPTTDYQQQVAEKAAETLGFTCSLDTQGQNLNPEQMEKCMAEYKEFLGYKPVDINSGENTYMAEALKGVIPEETFVEGNVEYGPENDPVLKQGIYLDDYSTFADVKKEAIKRGIKLDEEHEKYIRTYFNDTTSHYEEPGHPDPNLINNLDYSVYDPVGEDARKTFIKDPKDYALIVHPTANGKQDIINVKNPYKQYNETDPTFGTYIKRGNRNPDSLTNKTGRVGSIAQKHLKNDRNTHNRFFVPDNFFEQNAPTIPNEKGERVPNPNFVPSGDKDIVNNGFKPSDPTAIGSNLGSTVVNGAYVHTKIPTNINFNNRKNGYSFDLNGKKVTLAYGTLFTNKYFKGYDHVNKIFTFWNKDLGKNVYVNEDELVNYALNNPTGLGSFVKSINKAIKKGKGFRFTKKGRKLYRRYRKHLKHSKKRTKH